MKLGVLVFTIILSAVAVHAHLRPIIGVLSQPSGSTFAPYGKHFIIADYVKWLESAGARVAFIKYDMPTDELEELLNSINGVLFTGGGLDLAEDSTYFKTAQFIYKKAVTSNMVGDPFPIWGTCMGFQLLCILAAQNHSVLLEYAYDSYNVGMALELTEAAAKSRMFREAPQEVMETLTKTPATQNLHHDGVLPETFSTNQNLARVFTLLSTNVDLKGKPFASTMEGTRFPFFATQWHPERNQFEWSKKETALDHSGRAIRAMQYMATVVVRYARLSNNSFRNEDTEFRALSYSYPAPIYTGNFPGNYPEQQTYIFN